MTWKELQEFVSKQKHQDEKAVVLIPEGFFELTQDILNHNYLEIKEK